MEDKELTAKSIVYDCVPLLQYESFYDYESNQVLKSYFGLAISRGRGFCKADQTPSTVGQIKVEN